MTNEELCIAIQSGTNDRRQLLEQLYLQNSGMIEKIIRRYSMTDELDDLRQESFFGIAKAAQLWKPDKESSFINYAVYWIRSVINRYIENCGAVVRIPSYKRVLIGRYHRAVNSYRVRFGRDPSNTELCAALDISKDQLKELRKDIQAARIRSTNETIGGVDENIILEDTIASDDDQMDEVIDRIQRDQMAKAVWTEVDALPEREAQVIRDRWKYDHTLKECGEALSISPERVRQIEARAMRKLRNPKVTRRLLPYLEESTAHLWGLRGTGHKAFERIGSSQEIAVMRLEQRAGMNLQGVKFPAIGV